MEIREQNTVLEDEIIAGVKRITICRDCDPPHVSNCNSCFGYGLCHDGKKIIAAGEVDKYQENGLPYVNCPECGGSPHNKHLLNTERR